MVRKADIKTGSVSAKTGSVSAEQRLRRERREHKKILAVVANHMRLLLSVYWAADWFLMVPKGRHTGNAQRRLATAVTSAKVALTKKAQLAPWEGTF